MPTSPPNTVTLWAHQEDALAAVRRALDAGDRRGLIVLPTGAGKTVTFLTAARELSGAALVLVHRDELVRQTIETARRVCPDAKIGVIQADRDEWQDGETLVVASVQSLHADRLARMPRDRFGILVVDEAHHAPAASYQAVMGHFAVRFLLGVTATPRRLDGKGLCDWFGREALYVYPIRKAIKDGVLVPLRSFAVETGVCLDAVGTRCGDFKEGELADAVNTAGRNAAIVAAFQEQAAGRRAIAFAVDVEHVEALAKAFQDAGVTAASVTGRDGIDARRATLAAFAAGAYSVLVNCQIATEGFDNPAVDCIIMARPTKSQALYTQCVGRGLRRCDATGKTECLILDVTDNCRRHKLVTATSLLSEQREEATRGDGEQQADNAKQAKPAAPAALLEWRLDEVCPWPALPDLTGYRPCRDWQFEPASEGQMRFLRGFGLEISRHLTKGEASFLIDKATALEAAHPAPATPRQAYFLRRAHLWKSGLTKREASRLIGQLKGRLACA